MSRRRATTIAGSALLGLAAVVGCHDQASPLRSPPRAPTRTAKFERDPTKPGAPQVFDAQEPTAEDYESVPEAIGDEPEVADETTTPELRPQAPHPFASLSDAELIRKLNEDPMALGPATLGRPNAGRLFNAVQLPENSAWKRVDPNHAWATQETIDYLTRGLLAVAQRFPNTAAVPIGHLSAQKGGPLRPHVSHQSGRDVDVGFYYSEQSQRWYKRATADNLDLERTWWFIRTLVRETDIEMILVDQSLIPLIERYATQIESQNDWIEAVFHRRNGRASIVRHAPGHGTHLHLRFWNPVAQESGRRLMPLLVARGEITSPPKHVTHVARSGDTLAKLAARYSTTMQAIRQANAMTTYQLVAGHSYRIPVPVAATQISKPKSPPRRAAPSR